MLHVVQYLYPSGPPSGIVPPDGMESNGGGGGRIGDEFGGRMPGSVVAHIHSETMAVMDAIMDM